MAGWQPIETAESCTPLLLWEPGEGACVGFRYDGRWVTQVGDDLWCVQPTLWHELPEMPT